MKTMLRIILGALVVFCLGMGPAQAREQVKIVGSSTVYPFSAYVAEELGATTRYPTPVVEATGSGGGMKLFSEGPGMDTPDISNASRRMKKSEYERCQKNGVEEVIEVMFGYDGIALAQNVENPPLHLSLKDITLAVAREVPQGGELVENPYKYWDEINPDLAHREILIYGPPTTSGTRDAFEELVMEAATEEIEAYNGEYTQIRSDGVYVPSGENDNLIVQRLTKDQDALGIFGYSYLDENRDRIQAAFIQGVQPEPETITSGEYPVSRSLYFYVKVAHLDKVPGMQEYVDLFISEKMIGEFGYLKGIGLIALPKEKRDEIREKVEQRDLLALEDLS
ncbi:MAG: PstS family phosphate ABC transporter substrate-binding protein [Desulfohalobiaceae bacterium]|nr:PstS family phosphate ABC transporter substrate-binding protein [Desulfohalobiaceae bacterium]